jgi:hypothetical protein
MRVLRGIVEQESVKWTMFFAVLGPSPAPRLLIHRQSLYLSHREKTTKSEVGKEAIMLIDREANSNKSKRVVFTTVTVCFNASRFLGLRLTTYIATPHT